MLKVYIRPGWLSDQCLFVDLVVGGPPPPPHLPNFFALRIPNFANRLFQSALVSKVQQNVEKRK